MKKILTIGLATIVLIACNGGSKKAKDDKPVDKASNPDYQKGLDLVAKYKCMTCHHVDDAFTGPAYREVAKRYDNGSDTVVTYLAGKIIKGGNGVWGEVYMTPHPDVSQADAETMVKYILLLNK